MHSMPVSVHRQHTEMPIREYAYKYLTLVPKCRSTSVVTHVYVDV